MRLHVCLCEWLIRKRDYFRFSTKAKEKSGSVFSGNIAICGSCCSLTWQDWTQSRRARGLEVAENRLKWQIKVNHSLPTANLCNYWECYRMSWSDWSGKLRNLRKKWKRPHQGNCNMDTVSFRLHVSVAFTSNWYGSIHLRLVFFQLMATFTLNSSLKSETSCGSGPVQTSCFCRAELNSGIKFDKSTASESNFWIKFGKQLSSTSSAVLHDSGTAAIRTSCLCRAKQNS